MTIKLAGSVGSLLDSLLKTERHIYIEFFSFLAVFFIFISLSFNITVLPELVGFELLMALSMTVLTNGIACLFLLVLRGFWVVAWFLMYFGIAYPILMPVSALFVLVMVILKFARNLGFIEIFD